MTRLSYEQLEGIKEKFDVDRIWSYSRLSTFIDEPWIYRKQYLEKVGNPDNVYSYWGTIAHDLIQGMYEGEHTYEEMSDILESKIIEWRTTRSDLKFMNQKVEDGYIKNLQDYFKNTEVIPYEVTNEKPVCVHIYDKERKENIALIGYIDSEYVDDEGYFNIVDFKTSSNSGFSGKKLKEKARQLSLYAIGVNQFRGIPFEKIRLRFDMMKYYEVRFMQKNGKIGKSKQERSKWVQGMTKRIQKELFDLDYDPLESDEMMEIAILNNNLDNLPKEVQEKFTLHNLYIDVQITEDEAEELKQFVCDTVADIKEREKGDWDETFPEPLINASNNFYFNQLAPHLLKHHKRYQEEQKLLRPTEEVEDDDLLALFN